MPEQVCISLDAMGGDHAPEMVVAGAEIALKRLPHLKFLMFGDEARIKPLLAKYPGLEAVSEVRHASQEVTMDDKPSVALRQRRDSSMRLAINAVKEGDAQGVVSAGNTGALMAMAKFVLKTVRGIDRPAIATYMPTQRGETVMLDLGANIECDENNLVQFALMGEVFARILFGIEKPSVGLLNVGIEELKGNESVKKAAAILREIDLPIRFEGFVEGDDLAKGTVDVIVTDGFTGNVALKTAEGTARLLVHFLRETFKSSFWAKVGYLLARRSLQRFRERMDPRRYNGAMLLGLNGIAVKSHGGTDALGFSNAIGVCHDLIANRLNETIKGELAAFEEAISKAPIDEETIALAAGQAD
ncbi:phosphate acyltransferase PlsX [Thalassospira xianhensis]|uniref:Phosphate acyltransferase n=2 Tax=Thalassospira TaxID=168934 RepID=A0A285REQ1_9PROT|nr:MULTISPECIES: phosphate acyltransferase PlsX [Thalassospira]RCK05781.1 phosphate acyltransferase [Thalassospira xianhensis MCCC 1A02616]UKV16619.1 phosphate acyltransferase PlsX [Thalassospiraceae bacterium SW-3-3]SOB90857.1 phosphate:acyl-[acyl carrier protein] acyltransferase [Thalassospira xiamenensis]